MEMSVQTKLSLLKYSKCLDAIYIKTKKYFIYSNFFSIQVYKSRINIRTDVFIKNRRVV